MQGESKPLANYVAHFHQEVLWTGTFEKNIRLGKLWCSLQMRRPLSYEETHFQALQQIKVDEKCHMEREEDKVEATKSK